MEGLSSKTEACEKISVRDFLRLCGADKKVRASAKLVNSIVLTNILNRDTLNLPAASNGEGIKEIYVFEIEVNDFALPLDFINAMDKYIAMHTVFVFKSEGKYLIMAAPKKVHGQEGKPGKYYKTAWDTTPPHIDLPTSVANLEDVYISFFSLLIPYKVREGEDVKAYTDRYETIKKLIKETESLQKKVDTERQPKKRFAYNDELKEKKALLDELIKE